MIFNPKNSRYMATLEQLIQQTVSKNIPAKTIKHDHGSAHHPDGVLTMIKKKRSYTPIGEEKWTPKSLNDYKKFAARTTKAILRVRKATESKLAKDNNTKPLYVFITGKNKICASIGPLKINNSPCAHHLELHSN